MQGKIVTEIENTIKNNSLNLLAKKKLSHKKIHELIPDLDVCEICLNAIK